ncbi:hypothetical protein C8J57DRAFT_1228225 [Mycena rebaudengoi]|nr:hypothetical protein C8J57DRAFT_1228225 [Mycena rebaudengoi]
MKNEEGVKAEHKVHTSSLTAPPGLAARAAQNPRGATGISSRTEMRRERRPFLRKGNVPSGRDIVCVGGGRGGGGAWPWPSDWGFSTGWEKAPGKAESEDADTAKPVRKGHRGSGATDETRSNPSVSSKQGTAGWGKKDELVGNSEDGGMHKKKATKGERKAQSLTADDQSVMISSYLILSTLSFTLAGSQARLT